MLSVKRQWAEKITVWQNSGLSIAAWCRQNGENYHRFLYWRRRLQQTTKPCSHFVELTLESPALALACNGVTLQIERGFDRDLLREVLAVLKAV